MKMLWGDVLCQADESDTPGMADQRKGAWALVALVVDRPFWFIYLHEDKIKVHLI
jgi:hypothetical protein